MARTIFTVQIAPKEYEEEEEGVVVYAQGEEEERRAREGSRVKAF